jgi:hypothetical protein
MPIVTLPKGARNVKEAAAAPVPPVPTKSPKILSPAITQLPVIFRNDPGTDVALATTKVVPLQTGAAEALSAARDMTVPAAASTPKVSSDLRI